MPKPVAGVAEGHQDASGNGVYCFIRDLIVEGRDARFVNKKGRYVINWSRALKCYHDYKSKKNPQYKSKNINRRKASNSLRAALLNFYKKEGAKEYKDCKKVNEKDEVVERQFQMPPRVFESLFGSDVQLSDDSSEHETSSIASEADEKPLATPNSSDTGFDEAMDISDDLFNANAEPSSECALGGLPTGDPLCSNVKTEEDQVTPSDITTPCQMFDISEEELDLALEEICSSSETNDIDLLGVVHDICPSSGSVKGGLQFHISLTEALSEDDKSGSAHFDGIGDVCLERLNCYTLAGIIPASQQPGPVPVTVKTQDGHLLGMTYFMYVDEIQEVLKQVVKDPALQSLYLTMWSQEHGFFGSDGNLAQNLGPFTLQDQGSSVQGTCAQALKGLQLLVYTAAQTNAQQFIQMIFNTSAGKLIFDAYKDRPQLPEDVARANGHDDLAQYLQDVNTRLSKESGSDDKPNAIDWLELIEAVNKIQKQSSVIEDETDLESGKSKDDDNQSDYFADAETSSCGSFDLEIGWSDSEDGEGPCSKDGGSNKEPDVKSTPSMMSCEASAEVETQSDNDLDLADNKNYEEPAIFHSKPTLNLPPGMFRLRRKRRKGDATTSTLQGACVIQKVRQFPIFGQEIGGGTQKRENTSERDQEARACLGQEKCIQLKSRFSKDEQLKKEPDERLTPSVEVTSSEAPTVSGTNLDNEVDQKDHGINIIVSGSAAVGKSSWISKLLKKVAASGREEEARTAPSQRKTTKPKRTRKWLKGDDVTTSSQQGACVNETQEVGSFGEGIFQGVSGGGTQKRENINDRKQETRTGPSQAKRHNQRSQWRPFRGALLKSFLLLTIAVTTVLCLVAGIKLAERQLLHWAVRNGHIRISQALLKFVSDLDAPNFRGETPLHVATKNGYKDLAELLMKLGSNVNSKNYQQQTPLHLAAWSGRQEIADALIRHGSDVKARDDSQQTALHLSALDGHRNVLQVLIQRGSDVNAEDRFGWTPLHLAAVAGHKEIGEVLVQHGSGINNRTTFGYTPLHLATMNGHLQMVQSLIQRGSDVNAENIFGWTPLHLAAVAGHKEIGEDLVQHGSGINVRDNLGYTQRHLAAMNEHLQMVQFLIQLGTDVEVRDDKFQLSALHMAAIYGHIRIAELLIQHGSDVNAGNRFGGTQQKHSIAEVLIQNGSDVNARDIFGETPLLMAARTGDQEIAEFLIQHGSDPKKQDDSQQTPLHLPPWNGQRNIAEILIRYGSDVNVRNTFGLTPLHLAVSGRHKQIVEVFQHCLDENARTRSFTDENVRDGFQQTPIHLAARNGHKNIAEALIRYKCDDNARDTLLQTSLHLATRSGHQEIAEFLTRRGRWLKLQDESKETTLHLTAQNGHRNIAEVLIRCGSDVRNKFGLTQVAAHHTLLILHISNVNARNVKHEIQAESREYLQPNADVYVRNNRGQSPLHLAAGNGYQNISDILTEHGSDVNARNIFGKTSLQLAVINRHESFVYVSRRGKATGNLRQTPNLSSLIRNIFKYNLNPRNVPVISVGIFFKLLKSGKSLEDLLDEEFRQTINIKTKIGKQTSSELLRIHWERPACLAPVNMNMSIGLGDDVSGSSDHKLKMDNQAHAQCLNISLGGGDGVIAYFCLFIEYQGRCKTAYIAKCGYSATSLSRMLCSAKLPTNLRPKDRDGNEGNISHSFGFVDKTIDNVTNKVLILSELLPKREISYVLLKMLIPYIVLKIWLYIWLYILSTILRRRRRMEHSVKSTSTPCTKTTSSSSDATVCDRNGSQNGQSCLSVRNYCKTEIYDCYDVMSPATSSPVWNNWEEDIHDCYDVKSNETKSLQNQAQVIGDQVVPFLCNSMRREGNGLDEAGRGARLHMVNIPMKKSIYSMPKPC